jgi:hypothetical protein
MGLMEFLTVLLMTLGLFLILAGVFTAYFGSGKSRTIGVVLLVIGLLVGIIWVGMRILYPDVIDVSIGDTIWTAFVNILAALIGALIAIGAFLLAIMKS